MPSVVSDAVDAYVIRRVNARLQYLLLQRRADSPLGGAWQAIHTRIEPSESAIVAARRAIRETTGLADGAMYSADYVNQIFDQSRDAIVLVPAFALEVDPRAQVVAGSDFLAYEWCELAEATARLLWSGQRWALRHLDDVIGRGGASAEFYRVS